MGYAIRIDGDGRILTAVLSEYAAPGDILVSELPPGDISDYLYVDGAYVFSPRISTEDILNILLGVSE